METPTGRVTNVTMSRRSALRALGTALAVSAAASILAACGGGSPAAAPTTAPAAAPATAATAAPTTASAAAAAPTTAVAAAPTAAAPTVAPAQANGGKSTVQLWMQHPEWKDAMTAVIKSFEQTDPATVVKLTATQPQAYSNQLQTALNAGIGPDIFQSSARPQLDVQAKTGQLMDLSHQVDESAWTDVAKQAVTIGGKVWGVPGGKYTVGIAYHVDLFDKAGITTLPTTWADLTQAFDRLKAINVIPYSIAAKDGSLTYFNYIGLASSVLGLDGFNAVVAGTKKLTDPDVVAVVQQMINWSKYYQPNFVGTVYLESKALFATGKAAAMDAGSSDFNGFRQINPAAKFGFMYWPASDAKHKQCTNTGMEFTLSVNAKTKVAGGSISFVKWLGTTAGAQSMTDNVADLPVLNGVKPKDPLQQKMLATPLDVPVWYERFATENLGTVWSGKGQAPFENKMSAAAFSQLLQDSVNKQLAQAVKG